MSFLKNGKRYLLGILPNQISAFRVFPLSILIFVCFLIGGTYGWLAASVFFIIWGILDKVDGFVARNGKKNGLNLITKFGEKLDPYSDKLLIVSLYIMSVGEKWIHGWMVALIFAREITVSFYREADQTGGAKFVGKAKTFIQIIHLNWLLISHATSWTTWLEIAEYFNWLVWGFTMYTWWVYTTPGVRRRIWAKIHKLDNEPKT